MPVTINDVRRAVHAAIREGFPEIAVHSEGSGQEPLPPCFVVRLMESVHEQEHDRRYVRYHPFVIRYYAADQQDDDEVYDIAEQLTAVLQRIMIRDRPVRGSGMRFERKDGALEFHVGYRFHVWAPPTNTAKMRELEVQEGLK